MINSSPLEHNEAVALAEYLNILKIQGKILVYSHIPQETFTKSWGTKMRNRQEGVTSGVPDYVIVAKKTVLFIELKRKKGGTVSFQQLEWLEHLPGKTTQAFVAKGFDEAKEIIDQVIH